MSLLRGVVNDMREKRLWLLAGALLLALVAVPLLLSSGGGASSSSAPSPPAQSPAPAAPALPVVALSPGVVKGRLAGSERNPFTALSAAAGSLSTQPGGAQTTSPAPASTAGLGATGAGASAGASSAMPSGSGASSATPAHTPAPPRLSSAKPRPAPAGLSATESYSVSFAITNASGGFDTTDPLERLSPIPSVSDPLLIELGVLQGGARVLFAVAPGAVLSGPGQCIPGQVSCQLLALAPGQVESLARRSADGVAHVAFIAVTAISVAHHASARAALAVRRAASAAGRRLLASASLAALSLFSYDVAQGTVLDLRNLTVGGS